MACVQGDYLAPLTKAHASFLFAVNVLKSACCTHMVEPMISVVAEL